MRNNSLYGLIHEFFKYAIVGGIAFVVDFTTLWLCQEFIFYKITYGVYWATACGFAAGLVVNYVLSILYVFTEAKKTGKGRTVKAFVIFTVIGIVGLGLTEVGMWCGLQLHFDYRFVKIVVTGIILLYNYIARKIIIFR